jgi:hypothetical protein
MKLNIGLLAALAIITCFGCDKTQSPVQSSPVPSTTVSRFSVAGSVSDTALRPLADVKVAVIDGPGAGTSTVTDAAGSFALPGYFLDAVTLLASKDGYKSVTTRYPTTPLQNWPRVDLSRAQRAAG